MLSALARIRSVRAFIIAVFRGIREACVLQNSLQN